MVFLVLLMKLTDLECFIEGWSKDTPCEMEFLSTFRRGSGRILGYYDSITDSVVVGSREIQKVLRYWTFKSFETGFSRVHYEEVPVKDIGCIRKLDSK